MLVSICVIWLRKGPRESSRRSILRDRALLLNPLRWPMIVKSFILLTSSSRSCCYYLVFRQDDLPCLTLRRNSILLVAVLGTLESLKRIPWSEFLGELPLVEELLLKRPTAGRSQCSCRRLSKALSIIVCRCERRWQAVVPEMPSTTSGYA